MSPADPAPDQAPSPCSDDGSGTSRARGAEVSAARWDARVAAFLVAALFTVACGVVGWAAVRVPEGERLDTAALRGRWIVPPDAGTVSDRVLATISVASLAALTAALVSVAVMRRRPRAALAAATVVAGANVTTQALKHVVFADYGAFPSGHATVAMSLALAALLVAPRRLHGLAALVGGGYAAAVGGAVTVSGWHRPSEAVAGFLVAGAWAAAAVPFAGSARRRIDVTRVAAVLGAAVVLAAGAAGAAALAGIDGQRLTTMALIAAIGVIGACAVAVAGVVSAMTADVVGPSGRRTPSPA